MNQNDIQEILDILKDAVATKDWDKIYDAKEFLLEFLDNPDKFSAENT